MGLNHVPTPNCEDDGPDSVALETTTLNGSIRTISVSSTRSRRAALPQTGKLIGDAPENTAATSVVVGHETFALYYHIERPLNVVLTSSILGCYQVALRYPSYMIYVERVLSKVSVHYKASIKWRSASYPAVAFALHQRMMQFVKNLQYFVTVEVAKPSSHILQDRQQKVRTIDDVLELQTDMIGSFSTFIC
ncbi:hypothetical protein MRX96_014202 [Rhipicephalus microplus]